MRTNIVLDDNLIREALKISQAQTKKELINTALKEYVENHSRKDLREIRGKISFRKGYAHKKLRAGKL